MHERFGPAFLMLHEDRRLGAEGKRSFGIRLPLAGVSSLSVLPAFASRSWTHEGPPRNIKVLTKFWDRGESTFLQENFGLVSASFMGGAVASAHPDLFSGMTLITQELLDNKHYMKDERAVHVTTEEAVLDALGAAGGPLTLAQLSESFSPNLDAGGGMRQDGGRQRGRQAAVLERAPSLAPFVELIPIKADTQFCHYNCNLHRRSLGAVFAARGMARSGALRIDLAQRRI